MDKIKIFFGAHKILKIFMWAFLILLGLYIILVAFRVVNLFNLDKTNAQVEKIHNTKLSIDDVMGVNLPSDPGVEADKTVQGIDANENGIRDDVEIAIFKEYPNSAKTRAVLLQYALALQMEVIQPIENTVTVTEIITEQSRADTCVADTLVPRESPESSRHYSDVEKINTFIKSIEGKQFNTEVRKSNHQNFMKNLRSFGESTNEICDIDILKLTD
ncbi:MAG: hypothetical protein UR25_C0005G0045 [Candidatus Nomurabacteria bacterium GW2011_GWE1_32_28]|uniref:Uncharacterized protein n=1 Tax=Candidatus Nomurabacteria bacterium GW2011_GWF1_31_48 TaxID=1618767 RepID=A0A0G0BG43_9BACT|nr:MAG: hypothetical protein UR10_C0003G0243 [Candidatus Nomurabacteria bacterium GW2011_GWF2_30_133]KKP28462.1 MAG: hypothetical protein UR18_C0004G0044 [Candidatus Nomurabacteria bacterium GW2011_GWE2_31_40]KKP30042.1 MAG: hypothetical protein UR19_C0005G0044 [Candidatus Nomurabacteria bacterium GW2011_GWF1_31_48]KKP34561.1 MAG: hypothetical protein UR25_C0005G0045 [Candidatus Nomurabacteria bacterium GW2011_GWE1_32_28]HAS81041.1 hypothetical protein [Candidatus Nomurabacteria bacterium]